MKTEASDPKPAGQELDAQLTATGPWGSSRLGRPVFSTRLVLSIPIKQNGVPPTLTSGPRVSASKSQATRESIRRVARLAASRQRIAVHAVDAVDAVDVVDAVGRLNVSCLAVSRLASGQEVHNPIQSGDKLKQYLTPSIRPIALRHKRINQVDQARGRNGPIACRGSYEVSERTIPHFCTASTTV